MGYGNAALTDAAVYRAILADIDDTIIRIWGPGMDGVQTVLGTNAQGQAIVPQAVGQPRPEARPPTLATPDTVDSVGENAIVQYAIAVLRGGLAILNDRSVATTVNLAAIVVDATNGFDGNAGAGNEGTARKILTELAQFVTDWNGALATIGAGTQALSTPIALGAAD